jgi:membrane protease YdiL (CAAX protease family)
MGSLREEDPRVESGSTEVSSYVISPGGAMLLVVTVLFLMLISGSIFPRLIPSRLASLATEIIAFILPAVLVVQCSRLRWTDIFGVGGRLTPSIGIMLPLLGASFAVSTSIFVEIAHVIWPLPEKLTEILVDLMHTDSVPEFVLVVLLVAAVPAIAEEIVFRGIVQKSLIARYGPISGIGLTALIFAAMHLNPWSFVPLLIAGVFFGYAAYRTGTLWASSLAHFGNNLIAVIGLNLEDSVTYADLTEATPWYILLPALFAAIFGLILFESLCRRVAVDVR